MSSGWGCIVMGSVGRVVGVALILDGMYDYRSFGRKMYGNGRNLTCTYVLKSNECRLR